MYEWKDEFIDETKKKKIPYVVLHCWDCDKEYTFRKDRVPDKCECYKVDYSHHKWIPVVGYGGSYEINEIGTVISIGNKSNHKHIKRLKSFVSDSGYEEVILCSNGITEHKTVHRLLAEAFIPNIKNKTQINHKNGNKTHNVVSNLEWVTASENQLHYIKELKCK